MNKQMLPLFDKILAAEKKSTLIPFDTWATVNYALKSEEKFRDQAIALDAVSKLCKKDLNLFKNLKSSIPTNSTAETFCEKVEVQLKISSNVFAEATEKARKAIADSKDALAGCILSFDQTEISCPFGTYTRTKSTADMSRSIKNLQINAIQSEIPSKTIGK